MGRGQFRHGDDGRPRAGLPRQGAGEGRLTPDSGIGSRAPDGRCRRARRGPGARRRSTRMRRRARIIQFPWHRRAAPDARGDARCPPACVLSARSLFEPHCRRRLQFEAARMGARAQFRRPPARDPRRRMAARRGRSRARERRSALSTLEHEPVGDEAASLAVAVPRDAGAVAPRWRRRRGAALALKLTIANPGVSAFPFGLGWHPFFVRSPRQRISAFARAASGKPTRHDCPTRMSPFRRQWQLRSGARSGKSRRSTTSSPVGTARQRSPTRNGASRHRARRSRAGFLVVYAPDRQGFISRWSQ